MIHPARPPFNYHFRVGYADADQMGFLHHSRYWVYMESARTELLRSTGESYAQWEARGILLPLTDSGLTFRKPAYYDDMVRIETRIVELSRLRIRFAYRLFCDARSQLLAEGFTAHAFMTPEGRPQRVAPEVLERLGGEVKLVV